MSELIQKRPGQITHSAYKWLKLAKQNQFPHGNNRAVQALKRIERAIQDDFGPLNALQQMQLALLRPLIMFWLLHPGTNQKGEIASDFRWIHSKIENGLRQIASLADARPTVVVPTLEEYLAEKYKKGRKKR